jgi:crossover junction endodeoxyribonuclease RuvC
LKILSIDPGTRFAGYAVMQKEKRSIQLVNHGLLKIVTTKGWAHRIGTFYDFFKDKIEQYEIVDVAIETPFFYKNVGTFMKLGYMRGIIYLLAHQYNLHIYEYSPCEIKQAICAKGNATKQQIACMVYKYFPTLEKNLKDDVTDAIAIGLAALSSNSLNKSN